MAEAPTPPQSRRALRELERARGPRRGRVLGHRAAEQAEHVEQESSQPPRWQSAWVAAAESAPTVAPGSTPTVAPAPTVAPRQATPARAVTTPVVRAQKTLKRRGPLTAAAFLFAIGLGATSVIPMLALGQSATAAAATAVSVQSPEHLQQWKATMAAQLPLAERDGYSAGIAQAPAIFDGARHANTFVNNVTWAIQWPFPFGVPISYGFGPRVAPTEGASTFHEGVDFDPGAGTPVQIITKGVVEKVNNNPDDGLGVYVIVDHGIIDGHHIESYYCELAPGSVKVTVGQHVSVGDIVGLVGVSGISTGAHLHFELHVDGTPVDPEAWLRAHAG